MELLVVLVVIVVLAGMLLPALRQLKQAASTISCLGNLRQIGIGMHGYAMDHGGVFPSREMFDVHGIKLDWATWIAPYIEADRPGAQTRGSASGRILRCRNYPAWGVAQAGTNQGYAINFYLDTRQSRIVSASRHIHVCERTNDNGFGSPKELDFSRHPGNGHRNYGHLGSGDQYGDLVTIPITQRVGSLFADGRVQAVNKAQVWSCLKSKVPGGDL